MRLWLRGGRIIALIGLVGTLEGDPGGELAMAQDLWPSRQNAVSTMKGGCMMAYPAVSNADLSRQLT